MLPDIFPVPLEAVRPSFSKKLASHVSPAREINYLKFSLGDSPWTKLVLSDQIRPNYRRQLYKRFTNLFTPFARVVILDQSFTVLR